MDVQVTDALEPTGLETHASIPTGSFRMAEDAPAEPPPARPAPPADGPSYTWDDKAGFLGGGLAVLGTLLPWYASQGWVPHPTSQAWAAGGLAALTLVLLGVLRGPANERLRRHLSLALGGVLVLVTGWVVANYFAFHLDAEPKSGVLGHLGFLGLGLDLSLAGALLLTWSGVATRRPAPAPLPAEVPYERGLPWHARALFPLLIFAAAFTFFHYDVQHPAIVDWDETHYERVAVQYADGTFVDPNSPEQKPFNAEHPPVGKYLIALGYRLYGEPLDDHDWPKIYGQEGPNGKAEGLCHPKVNEECARASEAWRFGPVLAGSLGIVGMYWLGLRLFRSVAVGVCAAFFLLMDNLYFMMSRTALLDIFGAAFGILALGVFLGPRRWHPWVGSALFGVAVGSKYSSVFLLPAFFLLAYLWSRHTSRWMRIRDGLIFAAIVPFVTYLLIYLPYWIAWTKSGGFFFAVDTFILVHDDGFKWLYKADVPIHPQWSRPETWIVLRQPILLFVDTKDAVTSVAHIYALGNPFLWWFGAVAAIYTWFVSSFQFIQRRPRLGLHAFWQWMARPFQVRRDNALLLASLIFASAYFPFFAAKRQTLITYFVSAAPYLSLVLAGYVGYLWTRGGAPRLLAILALAAAAGTFAFYHPVVAGTYISEADFQYIMTRVPEMAQ